MSKTSSEGLSGGNAHASRLLSAIRTPFSVDGFQRSRLWIGPLIAGIVILLVGWWANRSVENAIKASLAGQLHALLDADVAALEIWLESKQDEAEVLARGNSIKAPVAELIRVAGKPDSVSIAGELLTSPATGELRSTISPWSTEHDDFGFVVINPELMIIGGDLDGGMGDPELAKPYGPALAPVFGGETIFIPPVKSAMVLPDIDGKSRAGIPVMFIATPVRSDEETVIAVLGIRIRPEVQFTKILSVAQAGESGETYAFNQLGVMITNSRFDENLKSIGLLPDNRQTCSLLNVEIRDPGVDMSAGHRPSKHRAEQPLTRMAESALGGEDGVDVDGYRDYRGVPVIGAWKWLPEYKIGVATEVDVEEAFQPLYTLRRAFGILTTLLFGTALFNCWLAWRTSKLELDARRAALTAKRMGQYALDELIGKGGMGEVYRAHHDMLQRPTAVKLLNIEKTDEQSTLRFEREVQLTSQLTHPNTIAIYDYGRTPEGVFYYAMEYLDGISLDELVTRFGPQPASRVIFLLRQLCGSLAEAHGLDLIHRDVKPANIMLTRRGGISDFVKLLDFGLVKPHQEDREVTAAGAMVGTPLYLPPEAIEQQELDSRSDLYSLGAVAYFLLTGTPVFDDGSITQICMQHVTQEPQSPSERLGQSIDEGLEALILQCLAKKPDDRPPSADALEEELAKCPSADEWSRSQATQWWKANLTFNTGSTIFTSEDTAKDVQANSHTLDQTIAHDERPTD